MTLAGFLGYALIFATIVGVVLLLSRPVRRESLAAREPDRVLPDLGEPPAELARLDDDRPGTLARLAFAGQAHAEIGRMVRDPDPEPRHEYEPSPHSNAGNCVCGMHEHHRWHPHEFTPARAQPDLCVCALGPTAKCHVFDAIEDDAPRHGGRHFGGLCTKPHICPDCEAGETCSDLFEHMICGLVACDSDALTPDEAAVVARLRQEWAARDPTAEATERMRQRAWREAEERP